MRVVQAGKGVADWVARRAAQLPSLLRAKLRVRNSLRVWGVAVSWDGPAGCTAVRVKEDHIDTSAGISAVQKTAKSVCKSSSSLLDMFRGSTAVEMDVQL